MTKSYDDFSVKITTALIDRVALFTTLGEGVDVKELIATNEDILTMFSVGESILEKLDDEDVDIEKRIEGAIEVYYQRISQGSSTMVGKSPAQKAREELNDITHFVSPMFEKAEWLKFFLDLPNDGVTRDGFDKIKDDDLLVVMVCVLVIIKSNLLSLRLQNMIKKPSRGARTHEPIVSSQGS